MINKKEQRKIYYWKFDKDTFELICEEGTTINYSSDMNSNDKYYLYYRLPSQPGNRKNIRCKDMDKYQFGRVVTFNNDKTHAWDIVSKALFNNSLELQERANKAQELYMNFRTFNPDPRRSK